MSVICNEICSAIGKLHKRAGSFLQEEIAGAVEAVPRKEKIALAGNLVIGYEDLLCHKIIVPISHI